MSTDDTNHPSDPRDTGETPDAHATEHTRPLPLDETADETPDPTPYPAHDPTPYPAHDPTPYPAPDPEPAWPAYDDEEQPRSGRHPLSISYLVAGLVFLGIAASWALRETGVVEAGSSSWLFPLTLVVVGAIGLAASVVSSARRP